jgi:hypothetical protein
MIGSTILVQHHDGRILCGHFNDRAVRTSPPLDDRYVERFRPLDGLDLDKYPFRSVLSDIRRREDNAT